MPTTTTTINAQVIKITVITIITKEIIIIITMAITIDQTTSIIIITAKIKHTGDG